MWLDPVLSPIWVAAAPASVSTNPADSLAKNGILGVLAGMFLVGVLALFKLLIKVKDQERDHLLTELAEATKRAERGEDEIRKLNDAFRESYATVLGEATSAVSDALGMVRSIKRGRHDD